MSTQICRDLGQVFANHFPDYLSKPADMRSSVKRKACKDLIGFKPALMATRASTRFLTTLSSTPTRPHHSAETNFSTVLGSKK